MEMKRRDGGWIFQPWRLRIGEGLNGEGVMEMFCSRCFVHVVAGLGGVLWRKFAACIGVLAVCLSLSALAEERPCSSPKRGTPVLCLAYPSVQTEER